MKLKVAFLTAFLLCIVAFNLNAQHELWGMTSLGGGAKGLIFKTDSAGNNYSIEYLFENFEQNALGTLIRVGGSKYYGLSDNGGLYGLGCIFEYDSGTDSVKVLHSFDGTATGAHPKGSLVQASNGKLYGMTCEGGSVNLGTVFEFDLADSTLTKLHDFTDNPDGRHPYGSLIQASDGKLYGMTREGGSNYFAGILFEFIIETGTLNKLYTFGSPGDGTHPQGDLIQASNGKLYGTTLYGGSAGYGNNGFLFEYDIASTNYRLIHNFDGNIGLATGSLPEGNLMEASNGKIYGMTLSGGAYNLGVIYEYDPVDDTLIKRYDFYYGPDCNRPEYNSLVEGSNNMLWGMTRRGGSNEYGGIFKFNFVSGSYAKVYDFTGGMSGREPWGSFIESSPGVFLGMTCLGGSAGKGLLFEYDTTSRATFTAIHSFDSYSTGQIPFGSLCPASNGKFYGLTTEGGAYNAGTLFEYDPFSGQYTKWHDFDGTPTGSVPNGSLIEANDGKFYGMAKWGGSNGQGTLFVFDPETGLVSKLHDFAYATGARPCGSLLEAANGKLYGMTSYGGSDNNYGVLFEFDISGSSYTVKINFHNASNGRAPEGSLLEASDGLLYGLTSYGGANDQGVLFEYNTSTGILTVKHNFVNATDGREARGDLIEATDGLLYGLTREGGVGAGATGTIFKYDITSGTLTSLHSFFYADNNGQHPLGSLVQSSNGKLYGLTYEGGTNFQGVFFEFDPGGNVFTKKQDFTGSNGSHPYYTRLISVMYHADWTGAVSSDWHDADNWLQHDVPGPFTEVVIPDVSGAGGYFPTLSSDVRVRDLTIDPDAEINVQPGIILHVGDQP